MRTCFLMGMIAANSACTAHTSADERLVGTWTLVSASSQVAGERPQAPYGQRPTGWLIYTLQGRMMALVSHDSRRPLSTPDQVAAPPEERARAFATHFSYAGRFHVDGSRVVHDVEIASVPNWVGERFVREIDLQGDNLTLITPPISYGGRPTTLSLTWRRAE